MQLSNNTVVLFLFRLHAFLKLIYVWFRGCVQQVVDVDGQAINGVIFIAIVKRIILKTGIFYEYPYSYKTSRVYPH